MARTALTNPLAVEAARDIAATLVAARTDEGVGRPAVVARMGWAPTRQSDLAALETGTRNLNLETLVVWADALGFDVVLARRS